MGKQVNADEAKLRLLRAAERFQGELMEQLAASPWKAVAAALAAGVVLAAFPSAPRLLIHAIDRFMQSAGD